MPFDMENTSTCNSITRKLKLKLYIQEIRNSFQNLPCPQFDQLNLLVGPQLYTILSEQKQKCVAMKLHTSRCLDVKLHICCKLDAAYARSLHVYELSPDYIYKTSPALTLGWYPATCPVFSLLVINNLVHGNLAQSGTSLRSLVPPR